MSTDARMFVIFALNGTAALIPYSAGGARETLYRFRRFLLLLAFAFKLSSVSFKRSIVRRFGSGSVGDFMMSR